MRLHVENNCCSPPRGLGDRFLCYCSLRFSDDATIIVTFFFFLFPFCKTHASYNPFLRWALAEWWWACPWPVPEHGTLTLGAPWHDAGFWQITLQFPQENPFVFSVSPFLVCAAELAACTPSQERGADKPIWFRNAQTSLWWKPCK